MLAVQKYISDTPVVSTEFVSFNIQDIDKYKDLFNDFKEKGVIHSDCRFEHSKWVVNDSVKNFGIVFELKKKYKKKFRKMNKRNNTSIKLKDFIIALKGYCLYSLSSSDPKTVKININNLKSLLNETSFLSNNCLVEDFFENKPSLKKVGFVLNNFLSFYDTFPFNEILVEYIYDCYTKTYSTFNGNNRIESHRRLLPLYSTMFRFNDIVDEFIKDSTGEERELYFPIILWWKITSIIPLRSTEFTITPKNCLSKNSKGKLGINLYRSVVKGNKKNSTINLYDLDAKYTLTWHPATQEIIDLINEYIKLVENYDHENDFYNNDSVGPVNRKYLLSARSYFKYNRNKTSYNTYSYTPDYLDSLQFNKLLKRFLHDVVCNNYNIPIVSKQRFYDIGSESYCNNSLQIINMMDTRHFAIMNLVHLGYSPSTIQRIVGHNNINTSYDYTNHQEVFTDCYIVSIAKKKAFDKNSEFKSAILDMSFESLFGSQGDGNRRFNMVKSKNTSSHKKYRELDEGYCLYDKDDLLPCKIIRGNHRRCKFFAPHKDQLNTISNELEVLSDEISSEIKTLQYLTKHHKVIKEFENKYLSTLNKLHSKEIKKAEMISDYIINGIDMEV